MNQDQINSAVARASDVVNGFKTVRDVLALAGVLAERDHAVEVLNKKVAELEARQKAADFADSIFGRR